MTLVSERADIEKAYARQLKQWAAKWNNIIEKGDYYNIQCHNEQNERSLEVQRFFICITGPEYGTMEAAWKAVLVESDRRCDLHNRVKEDMQMKVNNQLKLWQRENYHKVTRYFVYLFNGH